MPLLTPLYTGLDLAPPPSATSPARPARASAADVFALLDQRERDNARRNRRLLLIGLAILIGVPLAVFTPLGIWLVRYVGRPEALIATSLVCCGGGMVVFSLLLALLIHHGSRAHAIQEFLDSGTRPTGGQENPFARLLVAITFAGMLYGAFMCVDAIKTTVLRLRLRGVDRARSATVLAELLEHAAGVDPRLLLRHGEDPLDFRRALAYLMIHNWADISSRGDHLMLLLPSRRNFRETWTLD